MRVFDELKRLLNPFLDHLFALMHYLGVGRLLLLLYTFCSALIIYYEEPLCLNLEEALKQEAIFLLDKQLLYLLLSFADGQYVVCQLL